MEATRRLAEQGDREAQFKLAELYADGEEIKRDLSESMKWLQKSAKQGFPKAQLTLGFCYEHGKGIEQDEDEAVKWYRKAAEQGEPKAQYALGLFYAAGRGVEENRAEAEKWYRKAAEQGYPRAKEALEKLEELNNEFYWWFGGFIIGALLGGLVFAYTEMKEINPMLRRKWFLFTFISGTFFISLSMLLGYNIPMLIDYKTHRFQPTLCFVRVIIIIFLLIIGGIAVHYLKKKFFNKDKKDQRGEKNEQ